MHQNKTVKKSDAVTSSAKYSIKRQSIFQRTYDFQRVIADHCNAGKINGVTRQNQLPLLMFQLQIYFTWFYMRKCLYFFARQVIIDDTIRYLYQIINESDYRQTDRQMIHVARQTDRPTFSIHFQEMYLPSSQERSTCIEHSEFCTYFLEHMDILVTQISNVKAHVIILANLLTLR